MRLAVAALLLASCSAVAGIGTVTSITGSPGEITRGKTRLAGVNGAALQSDDIVSTMYGVANLRFADDSTVRVNENSRLLIDSFVYDPKQSDASRLTLRVGLGAVRYASGQIAKVNPQQVAVKTPTATISVRGTDMSMIVDEAGRSLVVLLPSCKEGDVPKQYELDENRCRVGKITVTTQAGTVDLQQAFEAVVVASSLAPPSVPVILNTVEGNVNINLLLSPPPEIQEIQDNNDNSDQELELTETEGSRTTKKSSTKVEIAGAATQDKPPLTNTTTTLQGATYTITGAHSATIVVETVDALIATCDTISLICLYKDDVKHFDATIGVLNNGTNPIVPSKWLTMTRTAETWEHAASVRVNPHGAPHNLTMIQGDSLVSLNIGKGVDANVITINQQVRR